MKTGLWRGYWFDMAGRKMRRLRKNEIGEAYRLYRIGTELGLTDRAVVAAPVVRSRGWVGEANPFHEETA